MDHVRRIKGMIFKSEDNLQGADLALCTGDVKPTSNQSSDHVERVTRNRVSTNLNTNKKSEHNSLKRTSSIAGLSANHRHHQSEHDQMRQISNNKQQKRETHNMMTDAANPLDSNAKLHRELALLKEKNESLRKINEKMPSIAELQSIVEGAEKDRREVLRARQEIVQRNRIIRDLEKNNEGARDVETLLTQRTKDYNELVGRYNTRRLVLRQLEGKLKYQQDNCKQLQERVNAQEETIKLAQADVWKTQNQAAWTADPDPITEGELGALERMIKQFCKRHATKLGSNDSLLDIIPRHFRDLNEFTVPETLPALADTRLLRSAPHLLLSAWLTYQIYDAIFQDPFVFVQRYIDDFSDLENTGDKHEISDFFALIEHCHKGKPKSYHTFRSDAIRLLNNETFALEEGMLAQLQFDLQAARQASLEKMNKNLLQLAGTLVASQDASVVVQQLNDILAKAAKTSAKLYAQRSGLFIQSISELPKTFEANSSYMEPHMLHHRDLEDNEDCLNGQRILLVTQPAVIAIGNSDGSDYTVRRVLKKAVVWMGKSPLVAQSVVPEEICGPDNKDWRKKIKEEYFLD